MTSFRTGDLVAHKKTGHVGTVIMFDDLGKMFILWKGLHWTTGRTYGEWRWVAAFRRYEQPN